MPSSEGFYWDSCVFISYFEKTPNRIDVIDELLRRSELGEIEIITSTASIVEVAYIVTERVGGLDPRNEVAMDECWSNSAVVKVIEPSVVVAKEARNIMRTAMANGLKKIRGMDAIHLASARLLHVTELQTYNYLDFDYLEQHTSVRCVEPHAVIQVPLDLTGLDS